MIDIGYFTAITMCYFLVEGYGYTMISKKWGAADAVRCDIIHTILSGILHGPDEYAVYTLFLCFLILKVMECPLFKMGKMVINFNLFIPVFRLGITGSCFTILFAKSKGKSNKQQYHLE